MYQKYIKRFLDIILAAICICISSPLLLLTALLVRIKLGSPIIFKQDRPGYQNKIFTLYKFRTMTDAKDEDGNLLPDEVRLTSFGKFLRSTSLDELPEFFNILFGHMSFIGPRPLLTKYVDLYSHRQSRRHSVLPGLTGLAQISGRNALSWEEKFEFDLEYVENISFWMDVKIFFTTIIKVFQRSDINSADSVTMEVFSGTKKQRFRYDRDRICKVLFTRAGDKVELIQTFLYAAGNLGIRPRIYGADTSLDEPALLICHEKRQICAPTDPGYGEELLAICRKDKIQLVIPTSEEESVLSEYKSRFEKAGICLLMSDLKVTDICKNAEKTRWLLGQCGLNTLPEQEPDQMDQYEVDVLCDFYGSPVFITPRVQEQSEQEEISRYRVIQDMTMIQETKRLIEELRPFGPMTFYVKKDRATGQNYFTRMKPFFSSHVPITIKAGADEPEAIFRMMYGEQVEYMPQAADDSIIFGRYEYSVCVNRKSQIQPIHEWKELTELGNEVEAVIFDLNDTLYSEKEYMRSGFKVVAEHLKQVNHCFNKLCVAFEKGKMPIETVLEDENIYSEELLEECLKLFREHKPDIKLYDGVEELFLELRKQKKAIAIVTDGKVVKENAKIDSLGIRNMVDEIIITDELAGHGNPKEFRKPNDIPYVIMRKRLGIACRNMAFVGDDKEMDFVAPGKLGMKCCLYVNEDRLYG